MNMLIKTGKGAGEMPKIIDNLEENLLSAARRLIAEHGYAAVTMCSRPF